MTGYSAKAAAFSTSITFEDVPEHDPVRSAKQHSGCV